MVSHSEMLTRMETKIAGIKEQYENKKSLRRNFLFSPYISSPAYLHRGKGNKKVRLKNGNTLGTIMDRRKKGLCFRETP